MRTSYLLLLNLLLLLSPVLRAQEIDQNSPEFKEVISLYSQAEKYKNAQQFDEAITTYQKAIDQFKDAFGTEDTAYGTLLNNLAEIYKTIGSYEKALRLNEEALLIYEKTLGKAHPVYAMSLTNLAEIYNHLGFHNRAMPLMQEALILLKKELGETHLVYGVSLNTMAGLYRATGSIKKSMNLYEQAMVIIEKAYGKFHPEYGAVLVNLAGVYQEMGAYGKALHLFEDARQITGKVFGTDHPDYATILYNLADLYKTLGSFEKALPLYDEALQITEKVFGKAHLSYGTNLNNLAEIYKTIGSYDIALSLYKEAVQISEKTYGKKSSNYGIVLTNLAEVYYILGSYENSLTFYLDARGIIQGALGKAHPKYGIILFKLGYLYIELGSFQRALHMFEEGLKITEVNLGKRHHNYGYGLVGLAYLYQSMGLYNKALPLFEEALEISEKTLGTDHPDYANILGNLGGLYYGMGSYEKAFSMFEEVLQLIEKALGKAHPDYATILNNLAFLYESMGSYDKALQLYQEALEISEKALGKAHPGFGEYLNNLAYLYVSLGLYEKSLPLFQQGYLNTQGQIRGNFAFQTEIEKEKFIRNKGANDIFNSFSNFNFLTDNIYEEALSDALNSIVTRKGLLLNANKNILDALKRLNREKITSQVSDFYLERGYVQRQLSLPIAERSSDYESRKEALETLERELVTLYTKYYGEELNYVRDYKQTPLKEGELAIEFTRFRVHNKQWTDSLMYVAYLYKRDWSTPKAVDLFEEGELRELLKESKAPKARYATRGGKVPNFGNAAVSKRLYELIWSPLEEYTKDATRIYYSPDGLLHTISFSALPDEKENRLGEVVDLNQMGNTADVRKNTKSPDLNDVLLIGGVEYNYTPPTNSTTENKVGYSILDNKQLLNNEENKKRGGGKSWPYLEGTKEEVDYIKKLLPSSRVWTSTNATEEAFKELSGDSPSVLHIATHGYFFADLKSKEEELLNKETPYVLAENPLLRSGLILANANYAWQNKGVNPYKEEDGILTALEISNLDLKKTDIVILSACETGLGDVPSSEGVYGLQRAFKMAGVETVIMALWKVPDNETSEFMQLFYKNWKGSKDPKQAFKKAQSKMMKKYKDEPEKWAAFVYLE